MSKEPRILTCWKCKAPKSEFEYAVIQRNSASPICLACRKPGHIQASKNGSFAAAENRRQQRMYQ